MNVRAAVWTPPGRGAIATIRVCGTGFQPVQSGQVENLPHAKPLFAAACGTPLDHLAPDRAAFGRWGDDPAEDVVVWRVAQDMFEIHCHGGSAACERILHDLESAGAQVVPWRTLLESTQGEFAAESADALARAPTLRCVEILADQAYGTFASAIEWLIPVPSASEIGAVLRWAAFGRHLTEPWQVVVTGRPNVGKSSLVNSLLGYSRAIVSETPGTTRDVVTAETAFDGWPVRLADTAGIRETSLSIEADGIARARQSLSQADLCVLVLDGSEPLTGDDRDLLSEWPEAVLVVNKADLASAWTDPRGLSVSCLTGQGIGDLATAIAGRLVPDVPPDGAGIPFAPRHVRLLESAADALAANDRDLAATQLRSILAEGAG